MQWTTTHSWDNLPDYPEPKPPTKRTRKPAPPTQAPSSLPVVKPSLGANISIPQNIHLLAFGAVVLIGCYLIVGRKSTPNSERAELGVGSIAVAPSANTDYKPSPDDRQAALDYIARYAHVAQEEQQKYGIPASITLAQGLLETDAGRSKMAQRDNNHFGIKCFSKSCKRGHCTNYTDDTHKDFFVKFPNVWASYRAHSLFLKNNSRYRDCFRQGNNYRGWAIELENAGYATSRKYAEGLIARIQDFGLDKFDQ